MPNKSPPVSSASSLSNARPNIESSSDLDANPDFEPGFELSFEAALAELELLVGQMESGKLSLEQSLNAYKRGAALVQHCQKSLANVEQQVRVLTEANKLNVFNSNDS